MAASKWVCVEYRVCPRGFSFALFFNLGSAVASPYAIALYLDKYPYWVYQNLNRHDAVAAMEDLEISEGPRGDPSWRAVLSRLKVSSSKASQPPIINNKI